VPNDLTQHADPAREAVEAVAIAGSRSGTFSAFEAGRLLGFSSRFEVEGFLKARGVLERACGAQDLADDLASLDQLQIKNESGSKNSQL
jgi:hypothetical protein